MPIFIEKGDLTKISCDAIVNPANSFGYMGGGVAGAIKKVGGQIIEKEAVSKAPIAVGKAIVTTSGSLPCKFVIHAPTMSKPATTIDANNVKLATKAAFDLAFQLKLKSIAIPGMGTGVGGVPTDDAARIIIEIAKMFEDKFEKIILIDRNDEMIKSFHKFLK
ncbi:MAG: macro domain-containing protein [Candidatus Thermoplasmatota archaeon]|jgi:O-acetyl-ADP-ribose deacetylase (regulator of RNase III)|nr:macro domain-containing protein [Candidatus Thermoplasmatota archaeon]